ncbi:MAG: hypothetical protein H0X42_07905 [Solirubrobacterales bacterium]|nr:hypothetical protein [Solirubrobacterales bacterium]
MSGDATIRRRLLDFELGLQAAIADTVFERALGRACLTPSLPMVWDASWIALEEPGMAVDELARLADEVLGGAGFGHRGVHVCNEADGRRLAAAAASQAGWEPTRIDYMVWREPTDRRPAADVVEVKLAEIANLRQELIREPFPAENPNREQIVAQLFERDRRFGEVAGDRWFAAAPEQPAAACRLLSQGDLGQVEDVVTLERARNRGLAQAVTLEALTKSREAGHEITFRAADGEEWPRLMYEKLGFAKVGELHTLHRYP